MNSVYSLKVNGQFITKVEANSKTTREEFVAFIKTFGMTFDDARDILEVECLDIPISKPLPFRTQSYMQVSHFAIETHLNNLIQTYGLDVVMGQFDKLVGIGRAS